MEKRVLFGSFQKVTRQDYLNLGLFPQQSLDDIVENLLIPDMAFSGFAVTQSAPAEVTVGNGLLFNKGLVYFNDTEGGQTVDLLTRLPAATKRIIAITAYGQEVDADLEARTYLTDVETRDTVARENATEKWRWANISAVSGTEGPDPQRPSVGADICVVAWVTVSTTGVESIERADDNIAPTLRGLSTALIEIGIWRNVIGTILDTLRSDLAALSARLIGTAQWSFVRGVARDVAWLKEKAALPDSFTSYGSDHFLGEDFSDIDDVDYLAKIEEGVRFPPAAGFDMQIGLLNPLDASVINSSDVLLPKWTETARITNIAADQSMSIAQYQYQTIDMVQKTMARQVVRYGTIFTVCTNNSWWQDGHYDWAQNTFVRGREVFEVISITGQTAEDWTLENSHAVIRLRKVWIDTVIEPYWERVVNRFSVSGSCLAESFVNAQDGWVTSVNLFFSQVAGTGDVNLYICETLNGMPDFEKIIGVSSVTAANLKVAPVGSPSSNPTKFSFKPTFLKKGRYAIVAVTSGNHYVWVLKNSNLVSGTLFYSTDGAFFQGDVTTDLAFQVNFAKFAQNRTVVQLNSLTLNDGIANIEINADTIIPDGCNLTYEIQKSGIWYALDNVDGGPDTVLNTLPPLLPFRAVFTGSESVQPGLGVASNSRVTTWRPRSDFRHISEARTFGSSTTVEADIRLEAWRGTPYHTFVAKMLHGTSFGTSRDPDVTSEEVAPDDPTDAIIRHYTWTGMGALTTCKFRLEGTTDNVMSCFHVAERIDIEHS